LEYCRIHFVTPSLHSGQAFGLEGLSPKALSEAEGVSPRHENLFLHYVQSLP